MTFAMCGADLKNSPIRPCGEDSHRVQNTRGGRLIYTSYVRTRTRMHVSQGLWGRPAINVPSLRAPAKSWEVIQKRKEDTVFCPFIKSECRDDCACFDRGECKFVSALGAFESVDPIDLANATEFVASLNDRDNAPLYVRVLGGVTVYNE